MTAKPLAIAILAAVVALAGCAPTPATPTPEASETPTPTPTPTVEAQTEPQSTIPLTCADLFSETEASALVGHSVVAVAPGALLNSAWRIAAQQGGALSCAWAAPDQRGNYFGYPLDVIIIDSTEQEYAARYVDDSVPTCDVSATTSYCRTEVLAGGYWASAKLSSRTVGTDSGLTVDSLAESWNSAIATLSSKVGSAGTPRELWVAPSTSVTGAFCDGKSALPADDYTTPLQIATARVVVQCSTADDWWVVVVPGGAWALPAIAQALPQAGREMEYWRVVDFPGTDIALQACGESCAVLVSVGGSAVSVSTAEFSGAAAGDVTFDDAARAFLPNVIAAG